MGERASTTVTERAAVAVALAAFVVSIIAVFLAHEAAKKSELDYRLTSYLVAYSSFVKDHESIGDPFRKPGFNRLKPPEQTRAGIVAGMLIGVVDTMYELEDPRACTWANYLSGMSALTGNKKLQLTEAYATDPRTIRALDHVLQPQLQLLAKQGQPCPEVK